MYSSTEPNFWSATYCSLRRGRSRPTRRVCRPADRAADHPAALLRSYPECALTAGTLRQGA
jgi:hypothetical protein